MYIIKNQANDIVLTLREKQTQLTQDWLFEFINGSTGEKKYCYAVDVSLFTSRYNEFSIIDNVSEIPLSGQLNFKPTGSWSYTVYEMPVGSPLNPATTYGIAEVGSLKVFDSAEVVNVPFIGDEIKDNAVFTG